MNYKVRFSYEDTVSEELIITSSDSNQKRLLNRLLKANPDVTEITILSQTNDLQRSTKL
tara:strand:+ start:838 stop:1014 length:177 start_codon:yes stop_codon:yes gene_type:complete